MKEGPLFLLTYLPFLIPLVLVLIQVSIWHNFPIAWSLIYFKSRPTNINFSYLLLFCKSDHFTFILKMHFARFRILGWNVFQGGSSTLAGWLSAALRGGGDLLVESSQARLDLMLGTRPMGTVATWWSSPGYWVASASLGSRLYLLAAWQRALGFLGYVVAA